MQDVQLYHGHGVQCVFDFCDRLPVPGDIDEQSAPRKAGLVRDVHQREEESVLVRIEQLQKCLQSAQGSYDGVRA